MSATHEITVLAASPRTRRELEAALSGRPGFSLAQDAEDSPRGLVVMEAASDRMADHGPDLPGLAALAASASVQEVIIAAPDPEPDLLLAAMRAGVKEFLSLPLCSAEIDAALERFQNRFQDRARLSQDQSRDGDENGGHMIYVLGGKGGSGTTTVAVNLAAQMASSAQRHAAPNHTALIDLAPPPGETPLFLDLEYAYTWADAARDPSRLDRTFLKSLMVRHSSGLFVLPAPDPGGEESAPSPEAARIMASLLRSMHPVTVVDGGCSLSPGAVKFMDQAQDILLVAVLSLPCLAGTRRLLAALERMNPEAAGRVRLVVNRHLSQAEISLDDARELLGRPIFATIANDYASALSSVNQGLPLAQAAPKAAVTRDLDSLAMKLGAEPKQKPARRGLLAGLLRRRTKDEPDTGPIPAQPQGA